MTQPIRVLILATYPTMQYGLRAAVEADGSCEVVATGNTINDLPDLAETSDPDVTLADVEWTPDDLEEFNGLEHLPPAILIAGAPDDAADALASGFRGALLPDAGSEEIVAAIRAVAAGLIVIDPRVAPLISSQPDDRREPDGELPSEALSKREREVLELIARGLPNKGIARELGISEHTVKFHVGSILRKFGASSRSEAIAQATRAGLIMI